ncbi:MAG: DUF6807 family protein [Planctomycetota bacterium]
MTLGCRSTLPLPAGWPAAFRGRACRPWPASAVVLVALLASAGAPSPAAAADLVAKGEEGRVVVGEVGGAPVASFVYADRAIGRPALRDLRAPGGLLVTRPCPPRPGIDGDDHATMHPGVMLCFSDLSGADPWRHKTAMRVTACTPEPSPAGTAAITCVSEYLDTPADTPAAGVVCRERSRITLSDRALAGHPVRVVTWEGELAAAGTPVAFGDVEEMGLGIRLIGSLAPRGGGRYLADHGGVNEKEVFGKRAAWVDAAGEEEGARVGVLVVPDAGRPWRFHARDTGWLLANPFGSRAYGAAEPGGATLAPGATLSLRVVLILHGPVPDDALGRIAAEAAALR